MELDNLRAAWEQLKVESKLDPSISEEQVFALLVEYQPTNKIQRAAINLFLFLFLAFICQGG